MLIECSRGPLSVALRGVVPGGVEYDVLALAKTAMGTWRGMLDGEILEAREGSIWQPMC